MKKNLMIATLQRMIKLDDNDMQSIKHASLSNSLLEILSVFMYLVLIKLTLTSSTIPALL